jgi:large subunit ribosomal protein L9
MSTRKNVKLQLTENVDNLGIVGDVVNVRAGYARNFLLPHNLATAPTEGARKAVEQRRKEVEAQLAAERAQKEALIAKLEALEVTIMRSANEDGVLYGSVTSHDVVEALAAEGHTVPERAVRLGVVIKHLDSYPIPIQLDKDLRTEIKLWVVSDKPAEQLMADAMAKTDAAVEGEATEKAAEAE